MKKQESPGFSRGEQVNAWCWAGLLVLAVAGWFAWRAAGRRLDRTLGAGLSEIERARAALVAEKVKRKRSLPSCTPEPPRCTYTGPRIMDDGTEQYPWCDEHQRCH